MTPPPPPVPKEHQPDKNIGRRIGERFIVEALLGMGGMGSIYRGRDERLGGEAVAIKFLKRALLQDVVLRERFRREALSLAKLRHSGIVAVLDFGEADGDLYTVLELVRGRTLADLIDAEYRSSGVHLLRAAPMMDQILAALEVCHDNDIIHRDLKPSNIMVSDGVSVDHVTIIDFGLARISEAMSSPPQDKLTETGVVQGTPHYMAPEQCRGEEVSTKTDIYSVGVVFYEILAGAEPFVGKDAATFMAQHLFVDPPPLRGIAPHVPVGVAAAVHRALAKQPSDRPTARELRQALASAFKGTDPETLAEAAAAMRQRESGLSRSERALTGRPHPVASSTSSGAVSKTDDTNSAANIVVWMPNDDRSASLRGCLGAGGFSCSLWSSDETPSDLSSADLVIVSRNRLSEIKALRAALPKLPIVVVDVGGPDETTASIRAGASDMLLRDAPDADLVPKIKRLLRRRK